MYLFRPCHNSQQFSCDAVEINGDWLRCDDNSKIFEAAAQFAREGRPGRAGRRAAHEKNEPSVPTAWVIGKPKTKADPTYYVLRAKMLEAISNDSSLTRADVKIAGVIINKHIRHYAKWSYASGKALMCETTYSLHTISTTMGKLDGRYLGVWRKRKDSGDRYPTNFFTMLPEDYWKAGSNGSAKRVNDLEENHLNRSSNTSAKTNGTRVPSNLSGKKGNLLKKEGEVTRKKKNSDSVDLSDPTPAEQILGLDDDHQISRSEDHARRADDDRIDRHQPDHAGVVGHGDSIQPDRVNAECAPNLDDGPVPFTKDPSSNTGNNVNAADFFNSRGADRDFLIVSSSTHPTDPEKATDTVSEKTLGVTDRAQKRALRLSLEAEEKAERARVRAEKKAARDTNAAKVKAAKDRKILDRKMIRAAAEAAAAEARGIVSSFAGTGTAMVVSDNADDVAELLRNYPQKPAWSPNRRKIATALRQVLDRGVDLHLILQKAAEYAASMSADDLRFAKSPENWLADSGWLNSYRGASLTVDADGQLQGDRKTVIPGSNGTRADVGSAIMNTIARIQQERKEQV